MVDDSKLLVCVQYFHILLHLQLPLRVLFSQKFLPSYIFLILFICFKKLCVQIEFALGWNWHIFYAKSW